MFSQARPKNQSYRNHSNIELSDGANIQTAESGNGKRKTVNTYRTYSQIGALLPDKPLESEEQASFRHSMNNKRSQKYGYRNRLAQTESHYETQYKIPVNEDPQFERSNISFVKYLNSHDNKFQKPYDECTKYVDNLVKNKELLRRGQFGIPANKFSVFTSCAALDTYKGSRKSSNAQGSRENKCQRGQVNTEMTHPIRSRLYRKKMYQSIEIGKSSKANPFDKTLQSHQKDYQKFLGIQRKSKNQEIKLKNSMNRILAAEMISQQLASSNIYPSKKTSSVKMSATKL